MHDMMGMVGYISSWTIFWKFRKSLVYERVMMMTKTCLEQSIYSQ